MRSDLNYDRLDGGRMRYEIRDYERTIQLEDGTKLGYWAR